MDIFKDKTNVGMLNDRLNKLGVAIKYWKDEETNKLIETIFKSTEEIAEFKNLGSVKFYELHIPVKILGKVYTAQQIADYAIKNQNRLSDEELVKIVNYLLKENNKFAILDFIKNFEGNKAKLIKKATEEIMPRLNNQNSEDKQKESIDVLISLADNKDSNLYEITDKVIKSNNLNYMLDFINYLDKVDFNALEMDYGLIYARNRESQIYDSTSMLQKAIVAYLQKGTIEDMKIIESKVSRELEEEIVKSYIDSVMNFEDVIKNGELPNNEIYCYLFINHPDLINRLISYIKSNGESGYGEVLTLIQNIRKQGLENDSEYYNNEYYIEDFDYVIDENCEDQRIDYYIKENDVLSLVDIWRNEYNELKEENRKKMKTKIVEFNKKDVKVLNAVVDLYLFGDDEIFNELKTPMEKLDEEDINNIESGNLLELYDVSKSLEIKIAIINRVIKSAKSAQELYDALTEDIKLISYAEVIKDAEILNKIESAFRNYPNGEKYFKDFSNQQKEYHNEDNI